MSGRLTARARADGRRDALSADPSRLADGDRRRRPWRYLWRTGQCDPAEPSFWSVIGILTQLAIWCVLAHVVEILIWAVFYTDAGVMPDIETAGYFSAVTYATTGYGDITPPMEWRVVASMGLIGILMCARSEGLIFAVASRLLATGRGAFRCGAGVLEGSGARNFGGI